MLRGSAPAQLCAPSSRGGSEISKHTEGQPKPEDSAERELGDAREECPVLAAKRRERRPLGGERVLSCDHHAASFVACFVTIECATSLDRDPTILISCQS